MRLNLSLLYRSASFLVEVNYRQICIMRTKQSLYLLSGASLNKKSAFCKFLKRSTMHKEEPSNQLERYRPYVDCRFHLISCQNPNLETSLCKFINALGHLKGRILQLSKSKPKEQNIHIIMAKKDYYVYPFLQFVLHSSSTNKYQLSFHHI